MNQVIELLLNAGFVRVSGTMSGRRRLERGDQRVSVGNRTTYFYRQVSSGKVTTGPAVKFKTKDFEEIKNHVAQIEGGN